ncbi:MAG TPA: hypothetical protein VEB22_11285 [Phycisphaerales bacterium]|nr:hypothetical protein [Phycisphaerales bacterium]
MIFPVRAYGAVGDAQLVTDGETTNASNTVRSASNPWSASDVGKIIWGVANSVVALPLGTITGFVNAGEITVSTLGQFNSSIVNLVWATQDDTAAFTAAFAAAIQETTGSRFNSHTILMETGGYVVSNRIYKNHGTVAASFGPQLVGAGRGSVTLYPIPGMTIAGDGRGALIDVTGYGALIENFGIYGCGFAWNGLAADQAFFNIEQAVGCRLSRVGMAQIGSQVIESRCLSVNGTNLDLNDVTVQGTSGNSAMWAMFFHGAGVLAKNCLASNFHRNVGITTNPSREPTGNGVVRWIGGGIDEGTLTPLQIFTEGEADFDGAFLWGAPDPDGFAIDVDATSKLWVRGCNIGRFGNVGLAGKALKIQAGGRVEAGYNTFRANAASNVTVQNDGRFVDLGGNRYANWNTGAEVEVFWRNAFTNPNQVQRF